mmetsp:Transcript_24984/g.46064  ORF Transcript_24984/g.46064 Transcript_24984/m.46064 type:complete len:99 (+) Transcript_24984:1633-1929(+)
MYKNALSTSLKFVSRALLASENPHEGALFTRTQSTSIAILPIHYPAIKMGKIIQDCWVSMTCKQPEVSAAQRKKRAKVAPGKFSIVLLVGMFTVGLFL